MPPLADPAVTPAVAAAGVAWLTMVGACFGSFLNVVIYRVPAGLSVVHPSSFCPRCKHPIRWFHNVPIFGWFLLRGKCYDCKLPISARYPLVEFTVAALFGGLAWIEVFSQPLAMPLGPPTTIQRDLTTAGVQCGYHLVLLCGLLCAGLMEFDGGRLPRTMALAILGIGVIVPLFLLDVRPVHFMHHVPEALQARDGRLGLADGAAGLLFGLALAVPATIAPWLSKTGRWNGMVGLVWVGVFLGWQAAAVLACAAATTYLGVSALLFRRPALARVSWSGGLAILTLIWILAWQSLARLPFLG